MLVKNWISKYDSGEVDTILELSQQSLRFIFMLLKIEKYSIVKVAWKNTIEEFSEILVRITIPL